jgi:hypothetical protein
MRSAPASPEVVEDPPHPLGEYFDRLRAWRRDHYRSCDLEAGRRKSRAILTMVHDEAVFFPIWLRYYSQFFTPEQIHVLDHDTTDGSTAGDGFVRIPVSHDGVSHRWMEEAVAEHQNRLIESHDVVLVTDVDEIVAPDPAFGTLGDYIDRLDEPWVNCLGYELLHLPDREPAIDLDRPVLEQRRFWFANDGYDKPALAMEPMRWVPGFHTRFDRSFFLDPDLRLIHLHRMDRDVCKRRHDLRRQRPWGSEDVEEGWAAHNRIATGEEFDRWFLTDSSTEGVEIRLEEIPERWRGLF